MSEKGSQTNILAIGFAMFSMYFGSGNLVYPIFAGRATGELAIIAILGLILTAVIVPLWGTLTLYLFDGDYMRFFTRIGKVPGWFICCAIICLVGPFAVIPRCILISHAAIDTFVDSTDINVLAFSFLSCVLLYFCCYKRSRIIEILGLYLTPVLLLSLAAIIASGLFSNATIVPSGHTSISAFKLGVVEGYNTMDLFASFIFSNVILAAVRSNSSAADLKSQRAIFITSLKASLLGMGLLALIYLGMGYVAALHADILENVPTEKLLSTLAVYSLGPYGGIVTSIAISLACLTTAITLSLVFAEFISKKVFQEKVSYNVCLAVTLVISFVISALKFTGIQAILVPILQLSYPALIMLTFMNMLYKVKGIKFTIIPVGITFLATVYLTYFSA